MSGNEEITAAQTQLFSGYLVPVFYLRLVEALSVEHQGNVTAIERSLHNLGRQMVTPILLGLVRSYGDPPEAFIPSEPDLFLNRVDEYISKNWQLATGSPPEALKFINDRTLTLRTSSCPLCHKDAFQAGFKLRYCELIAGILEGILKHWIENLGLAYTVGVTETMCRLQDDDACVFRIHFEE